MSIEKPDPRFARFGKAVHDSLTVDAPFGSLSKSELDLAIFTALVEAGIVDPDDRPFRLAQKLRCTPARASSLVFNYRLRNSSPDTAGLVKVIKVVKDSEAKKHRRVILNVEQRFWREVLIDELKTHDVFTDGSFNRERLVLDADDFVDACSKIFGEEGKRIAKAVKAARKREPAEVIQELVDNASAGVAQAMGGAAAGASIAMVAHAIG